MKHSSVSIALLSLLGPTAAKVCMNMTVPVAIESRQGLFQALTLEGNLDATNFSQQFTNNGHNLTQVLLQSYQTLTGTYNISAKFCHPDSGISKGPVQVLSHGIGFDKTYWDLAFNNYNYSYTNVAVDKHGYNTLAIDRLGIGNSSHGDPLNVVQAQAEVEALYQVTMKLRNGEIPSINQTFSKVVHAGHSFGSIQSQWLSALYPNVTDGLILTGYSTNSSFLPTTIAAWNLHLARLNQPLRFGNYSTSRLGSVVQSSSDFIINTLQQALGALGIEATSAEIWNEIATTEVGDLINGFNRTDYVQQNLPAGYLTWSDLTANQYAFLLPGFYDPALGLVAEMTKQPVTTGEILTLGSQPKISTFTGPVLVVTGEKDAIFCGGDCYATGGVAESIPAAGEMQFPDASAFEAYIQPNTAHGINVHYNSTGAYEVIQNWLAAQGLGSS